MRTSSFPYVLSALSAIVILAGCSSGGSSTVAPGIGARPASLGAAHAESVAHRAVSVVPQDMLDGARPDWSHLVFRAGNHAVAARGLYVGQFASTKINEYKVPNNVNNPPFCTLSGVVAVNGLGVQPFTRNLYIPDGGSRRIIVRKPACGSLVGAPLSDPHGQPADVAFNEVTGTIYVSNILNDGGSGSIEVYKKTDHLPSSQLTDSSMYEYFGIETDKDKNVWETYIDSNGAGHLIEFPGGKMPGQIHNITGPSRPGGLDFDKAGNMVIIDINEATPAAYVYAPPYTGGPSATIPLKGGSVFAKLDCVNKNFYVSDFHNGTIDVYTWPSGTYEYSISNGLSGSNNVEGVGIDSPDRE